MTTVRIALVDAGAVDVTLPPGPAITVEVVAPPEETANTGRLEVANTGHVAPPEVVVP